MTLAWDRIRADGRRYARAASALHSVILPAGVDVGEYLYRQASHLFTQLESCGAVLPPAEVDVTQTLAAKCCLLEPWRIDDADASTVVAVISTIAGAAKRGDFALLVSAAHKERPDSALCRLINRLCELAEQAQYMASLPRLACPACGRELRHQDTDPHTRRTLCRTCDSVVSTENAMRVGAQGLRPPTNLFDSFYEAPNPDRRTTYQYDVFVSYRHVRPDADYADELARALAARSLRVFHAPRTLSLDNLYADRLPTRWIRELEHGLLTSAHVVVVLTRAFLTSSYCELELRGAFALHSANTARRLWLATVVQSADRPVPQAIQELIVDPEPTALVQKIESGVAQAGIVLGSSRIVPERCFPPLPLESCAWGDVGGPADPDPPRSEFESVTRELMVLYLRGIGPDAATINFSARWQERHIHEAKEEARALVDQGVRPYPLIGPETAGGPSVLRDLEPVIDSSWPASHVIRSAETLRQKDDSPGFRVVHVDATWCDVSDFGGHGYPQDMDLECRHCHYQEAVGDPRELPPRCPTCGFTGVD